MLVGKKCSFSFFVDKVHYRSQPVGTDNSGLVYDIVSLAKIECDVAGSLNPVPVALHIKPPEYGRGLWFTDSTVSSDNSVAEPCPQWATRCQVRLAKRGSQRSQWETTLSLSIKNYSRNFCYHNALYMSATALKRWNSGQNRARKLE